MHLSKMACDVRFGKLLLYGAMLGCGYEAC